MTISRNMKVCCVLLVIALTGSTVSSAIPRKDPKDRTLERELSDEKHYEEDGDHNTDYDHEAFLGEDESKSFEDLSPDESREKLAKIVEKIDKDKDGSVTEKELQDWVQYVQTRYLTQDTERQWKDFETDGEHLKWEAYKDKTYGFVNDGDEDDKEDKDSYAKMMVRDEKRWKAADGDKDGSLNKEEFTHFLHPEETPHMRDIVVEETIDDIDKDKDGMVDVNEYIGDMYSETDGEEPDWVQREREQFTEHRDKDKDGKLNRAEIKEWIVPEDYDHTDAEAKHLIYEADADKNGVLSKEEILDKYDLFVGSQATDFGEALNRHDEF